MDRAISHSAREDLEGPGAASVANEVAKHLRERILIGELQPRARLTLRDIASEFGISMMPARDAVRQLLREGLAIQEGQKTIVVAPMSVMDFIDIMEIRIL